MKRFNRKPIATLLVVFLLLSMSSIAEDGNELVLESSETIFIDNNTVDDSLSVSESIDVDLSLIDENVGQNIDDTSYVEPEAKANVTTKALKLGVKETFAINVKKATFKSSNKKIATVSRKGVITAKKKGSAQITIKSGKKTIGLINLTVLSSPKKVTLSETKLMMNLDEKYALTAILPKNTASKLKWSSSNKEIAVVDANGFVTALKAGTTTITARTFNNKKASCKVTVRTTIDEDSSASCIETMQKKLISLGLLPSDGVTGFYDSATREAVRRFQTRVNELAGYDVLEVTGIMDDQSQAFLDYYVEEWERIRQATPTPIPKPTPTPMPTPSPESTSENIINADASKEDILKVQRLLISIGMLPEGSDDGVYRSSTVIAVADFQRWVNEQRKETTLAVTGEVDQLTLLYLQYCDDHGMRPYGS